MNAGPPGPAAEDRGCGCLHAGGQASQAAVDMHVLLVWLLAAVAV